MCRTESNRDFAISTVDPYHRNNVEKDGWCVLAIGITILAIGILLARKVINPHFRPTMNRNCVIAVTFIFGSLLTLVGAGFVTAYFGSPRINTKPGK